jgi:peptidoglycan/xylan/chitin deacetylase (PgdA/CDA1 family)
MNKFIENYSELIEDFPFSKRDKLRHFTLDIIASFNSLNKSRLKENRIQMLYFHHIFKDEEIAFEKTLQRLSEVHTFISYSEAIYKIKNNQIDKPYIVFSSDDGFLNNIRAAEILKKFNISACFFINPDLIDEKDFNILKKHCNEKLNFSPTEMLSWKDVEYIQKLGHEIGSHTMNHFNVAKQTESAIIEDMTNSYELLTTKCGEVKHFAFPYGRFFHFNQIGKESAFKVGYESCATAERGCHIKHDKIIDNKNLCIRRDQYIAAWPYSHLLFFMLKNINSASFMNNIYPY